MGQRGAGPRSFFGGGGGAGGAGQATFPNVFLLQFGRSVGGGEGRGPMHGAFL